MSDDPASRDGLIWEMQQHIERLTKERDDLKRLVEELYDDKFQEGRGGLWQRFCEEGEL